MCTNHNQVISNYAKQFLTPHGAKVNIKQVTDWTKRVVTSRACLAHQSGQDRLPLLPKFNSMSILILA